MEEEPLVIQHAAQLTCVFCGQAATHPRTLLSISIVGGDNFNRFVHVQCFRSALHPSYVDVIDLEHAILNPPGP